MAGYSLRRFLRNIKFLLRYSLEEREIENRFQTLLYAEDMCRYEVLDPDDEVVIPKILSPEKTAPKAERLPHRSQRISTS